MSKYCKAYALRVTYLDCMECETKECKRKGNKMVKRYLQLEPEQKVFLVFASKREGYKDNIVISCNVREATIRKETTIYVLESKKVVTKNLSGNVAETFLCTNAQVDTGYRGLQMDLYPVFTTKEKCLEWLKA